MKILSTVHDFSEDARVVLESFGEVTYGMFTKEELVALVPHYDALLVRIGIAIDRDVIEAGTNLKAIATATTGLNHIDLVAAEERGITILSLRGENAFLDTITSTAELAFGLMIDLARFTPWAFDSVKNYNLDLEGFRGRSLYGKTLGIVGMGRLGKIIAAGARGWRMNVIFADPYVPAEQFPEYTKVTLEALLRESDIVSLHVHLTEETEGMLTRDAFALMKKSAYLINTSRGELLNEAHLVEALESGTIAGYGTDVLSRELELLREFSDHALVEYAKTHRNCIIVPHTGGLTSDSRTATDIFIAQKLAQHLKNNI